MIFVPGIDLPCADKISPLSFHSNQFFNLLSRALPFVFRVRGNNELMSSSSFSSAPKATVRDSCCCGGGGTMVDSLGLGSC